MLDLSGYFQWDLLDLSGYFQPNQTPLMDMPDDKEGGMAQVGSKEAPFLVLFSPFQIISCLFFLHSFCCAPRYTLCLDA